jgi:hypothetical protein
MPTSNAEQLIQVFQAFVGIADDVSAIPKYVGGQAGAGGAGRTASGLAMLMGNASKILQTVSANIDRDVFEPLLLNLTDMIMLTDTTGLLTGEEKISVQGVDVAVQRETLRQRQIEFLSATNNPTDLKITGIKGRGVVLRGVSQGIGLPGEDVVPSDEVLEQMEQADKQAQAAGPLQKQITEAVDKGVAIGVQKITSEVTAGILAPREGMTEGPPAHVGTPPGSAGEPMLQGGGADAAAAAHPGGLSPAQEGARQASGSQPSPQAAHGLGPTTANVVGNTPGPNAAKPISPGVG